MDRLVIFGKGGIGKSTTSCNLSATAAMAGQNVLHIGCDPKQDSTVALMHGELLESMTDRSFDRDQVTAETIVSRSPIGVDCVEAGGPGAGLGCGGRAITRMLEVFKWADLMSSSRYDLTIFDVLGDLVCGGFAAPLKRGCGRKVVIVASEEVMALYAANNIAKAVVNYASNGAVLAGIVCNLRNNDTDREPMENFAKLLNTKIITYIPRDELIREAEYERKTVVEMAPDAPISQAYATLLALVRAIDPDTLPVPTPLDERQFYELTRTKFVMPVGGIPGTLPIIGQTPLIITPEPPRVFEASPAAPAAKPELESPEPVEATPEPEATEGAFHGQTVAKIRTGAQTVARFQRAFGKRCTVLDVTLTPDTEIAVEVEGPDIDELRVLLTPRSEDKKAFRETPYMGVSYWSEEGGLSSEQKDILETVARRLRMLTWEDAEKVIRLDPEVVIESTGAEHVGAPTNGFSKLSAYVYGYGSSETWYNFFADNELERGRGYRYKGRILDVLHTELECSFGYPAADDGAANFFVFPRSEPAPNALNGDEGRPMMAPLNSDLRDMDTINTGNTRLAALLEEIRRSEPDVELVTLSPSCTPIITGDDLDGLTEEFNRTSPFRIVRTDRAVNPQLQLLSDHILAAAKGPAPEPVEHSVNLVGFPRLPGRTALEELIERCGITIHRTLLPEIDPAGLKAYAAASAQVFYPHMDDQRLKTLYGTLREQFAVPSLEIPLPMGLDSTIAAVAAMGEQLGIGTEVRGKLSAELALLRAQWNRLKRQAVTRRLGLVVNETGVGQLDLSGRLTGIPVVEVIAEMGFGLDVLVFDAGHGPGMAQRSFMHRWPELDARFVAFRTQEELEAAIRASDASAFYSELQFDHRLSRAGKARFGPSDFGMGAQGAIEALRRLLTISRMSFFSRYADHLQ